MSLGFPGERVHVVPCGVDPRGFDPATARPEHGRLLAVGRLVEKKAPDLLIAAFAELAPRWPNATLEIIGDGPLRAQCLEAIGRHGLMGRVVLQGARDHAFVCERMRAASIFVQHSVTAADGDMESFGVAMVEAMMTGLPVIATRHGGFPQTIAEGETGFLVDEGDVSGMAAAIERLLAEPELAARMGAVGARRARRLFSRDDCLARLRAVLGLDERAGGAAGARGKS